MEFDFSGWATKYGVKCSDGRTILPEAFVNNDGIKVPLVWQHGHNDPSNLIGHAVLKHNSEGVYVYGKFNSTDNGQHIKRSVQNGDVNSLSIWANNLQEKNHQVMHGNIREVSVVLAGANPEAFIDYISLEHSEETGNGEAYIYSGEVLSMKDDIKNSNESKQKEKVIEHQSKDDLTIKEIIDSMSEEQRNVLEYMVGQALEQNTKDTEEDSEVKHNLFENEKETENVLSHAEQTEIFKKAEKMGSLKAAIENYDESLLHSITNIDVLFPDAQDINRTPQFIDNSFDWVTDFLSKASKSPFSRIKTTQADITADEARARGYIKGSLKKDEVFKLLKRVTTPTTIYKKQKLDRDDIIDITSFDVVAWMRNEMRVKLDQEIARAALISDGRATDSPDKINEENIRPIWKEQDLYVHRVTVDKDITPAALAETILREKINYKGTGSPTLYITPEKKIDMLLQKDTMNRRLYDTEESLKAALGVSSIVEVEQMSNLTRQNSEGATVKLEAIMVNPKDYVFGTDKGGQVSMFDDFDIDYNQYKYLLETRLSGALTLVKSAVIIESATE